jgi:hypothetical protein
VKNSGKNKQLLSGFPLKFSHVNSGFIMKSPFPKTNKKVFDRRGEKGYYIMFYLKAS